MPVVTVSLWLAEQGAWHRRVLHDGSPDSWAGVYRPKQVMVLQRTIQWLHTPGCRPVHAGSHARLLTLNRPCHMAEVYCPRMRGGCLAAMLKKARRSSSVCMHRVGEQNRQLWRLASAAGRL